MQSDSEDKTIRNNGDIEKPFEGTDEPLTDADATAPTERPDTADDAAAFGEVPPQPDAATSDAAAQTAPPAATSDAAAQTAPPASSHTPPQTHAKRRQFFITAVALQLVLLVAISIPSILTLLTGRVITFDTTPVDPWDFFRGDYVTLAYTFSQVPTEETFKRDERAFVVLKEVNETWDARRIQKTKPTSLEPDEITIKATVTSFYDKKATVTYGIERVYIPERTGTEIKSGDRVQVDVALGDNGLAVIKEVRAKDVPIYQWRLL